MTDRNNGGPAFPLAPRLAPDGDVNSYWTQHPQDGMSLRDWFAGQALYYTADFSRPHVNADNMKMTARLAYDIADAMLAERSKP